MKTLTIIFPLLLYIVLSSEAFSQTTRKSGISVQSLSEKAPQGGLRPPEDRRPTKRTPFLRPGFEKRQLHGSSEEERFRGREHLPRWLIPKDPFGNVTEKGMLPLERMRRFMDRAADLHSDHFSEPSRQSFSDSVHASWVSHYASGLPSTGDMATAIAVDGSGNVYVTGWSWGSSDTGDDYTTVKYNSAGVEQWVARYNGPGNNYDRAAALAIDGSGNVYVTGVSWSSGWYDYNTVKYNSAGVEQWVARYNGPGNNYDRAAALAIDGSGNVYVTGLSEGSRTYYDYATVKYNSAGVEQWVARYNGPGNNDDYATALSIDGSGNVYVTGESWGSYTGYDYTTVKYNSAGVEQWAARYNEPGNASDEATALAVDGSGSVYVTGWSVGSGTRADYATVKYNSAGVEQWVARYNGPGNSDDYATALSIDGSGNVYVTGESWGSDTWYDYATVKYNSAGVEQWVARYNGPENSDDYATALSIDGSGNVYVTGRSSGFNWSSYTTIKYIQTPVSVEEQEIGKPCRYWLAQNYPNPFNPSTKIKFTVANKTASGANSLNENSRFVTLKIYDILGREITTLINEPKSAGIYEIEWNAANIPSGVYLYKLTAGEFSETKKMLLMK